MENVKIECVSICMYGTYSDVKPVIAGWLVCINHNVISLTNAHEQAVRCERVDRDHVGSHDIELVALKLDVKVMFHRRIHQAQEMALARLELDTGILSLARIVRVDVGSIEENVAARWGPRDQSDGNELVCRLVVRVADGERAKIDIPVVGRRPVDHNRAPDAISILRREVRVIPGRAILSGPPAIGLALARRQRALRDAIGTVVNVVMELANAVPMDGCSETGY